MSLPLSPATDAETQHRMPRRAMLAGLALLAIPGPVRAQRAGGQTVVVIDMQAVLREAAAAAALRAVELEERRALRERLDAVSEQFRTEEAALTELKGNLANDAFDTRVRDFDQRVRAARQEAQEASVAFQNRFAEAYAALEKEVSPVIASLMAERGASIALDRRSVLFADPAADLTREVILRLDRVLPAEAARDLLPPTPGPR